LQHQLAARAQPVRGTERAMPVEDRGGDAPIVEPEPRAAGEQVEPGHHLDPVRPVPARRLGRPIDHLVAIGADDDRPLMLGPAQDHQSAHSALTMGFRPPPSACDIVAGSPPRHRYGMTGPWLPLTNAKRISRRVTSTTRSSSSRSRRAATACWDYGRPGGWG